MKKRGRESIQVLGGGGGTHVVRQTIRYHSINMFLQAMTFRPHLHTTFGIWDCRPECLRLFVSVYGWCISLSVSLKVWIFWFQSESNSVEICLTFWLGLFICLSVCLIIWFYISIHVSVFQEVSVLMFYEFPTWSLCLWYFYMTMIVFETRFQMLFCVWLLLLFIGKCDTLSGYLSIVCVCVRLCLKGR